MTRSLRATLVQSARTPQTRPRRSFVPFQPALMRYFVYQLNLDQVADEMDETEQDLVTCQCWTLPSLAFHGLWDSLIFDGPVKKNLLEYTSTAMLFSDKKVDSTLVSWNRVVLLHGPPGTGKTSVCKALAQKLAIRLSHRYRHGQLIEVNAHSLFSKWFSESGKLVLKLFQRIKELMEDQTAFICVLLDEVESLSAARKAALSGSEPTDSIRVVNALLTQLDSLKRADNVLILTTSNIAEAIDLAFVDRADIKQFIGYPSVAARYEILRSGLLELQRVGIVAPFQAIHEFSDLSAVADSHSDPSTVLCALAQRVQNMSGRVLRKLPFLAHAWFVQAETTTLAVFLDALDRTIDMELNARQESLSTTAATTAATQQ
eukprot:gnl/Spiro4/28333_TR14017_c0_g1_i1.p1 gnl/Spiro4/28333_TR14017_c0_g1~~gnl/Spiro4/28333_TR14017_c0_g1_i1.p1  ORF type:complete len:375 (+),score=44.66 gnl/Spiro4/28333_TR14017_c0_g1_i1:196-1320(+)